MKMLNLSNHLLIATPQQADNAFAHSVVYICQHDTEGAMGLVLSRPLNHAKSKDILNHLKLDLIQVSELMPTVLAGGPVRPENGFVLHSPIGRWNSSITVTPNIAVTVSKDILSALASGQNRPQKAILALGYAGWSSGQLAQEITKNDWLVMPAPEEFIFEPNRDRLWQKAMVLAGIKNLATFSPFVGHG